jgi:4-hydroxythreonine-4-phosphate dehydrogenase
MEHHKIRIGITQGDINGTSYEIMLKTFQESKILEICTPIIYGSPKVAAYHRKALNISNFSFNSISSTNEAQEKRANLINVLDDNIRVELGKSTPMAGEAAIISLEKAVDDLKNGLIDALVTNPLNHENTNTEALNFHGHTDYLRQKFNIHDTLTFMTNDLIKVGVLTGHVPMVEVEKFITIDNIIKKLRIINKSLVTDFGIRKPKIAVLGFNPHAGNAGVIGKEELEVIIPSIEKANNEGIFAMGPYASEQLFSTNMFKNFDAVLAMYHDQGVTPYRLLCYETGVNYTAGLTAIRTTPDQGVEYEIAGLDQASPNAFRNAIYLACDIFNNRIMHKTLSANPLPKYEVTD